MFTTTVRLFAEYLTHVIDGGSLPRPNHNQTQRDLAVEVLERLRQLNFIVGRVQKLEHGRGLVSYNEELDLETRTLSEAFYYIGSRIRGILNNGALPGLASFECPGVRNVRNKLLEHPDGKDSGVLLQSFGYGGDSGPRIKALRRVGQENTFPDAGLYGNAREFKEALEHLLLRTRENTGA